MELLLIFLWVGVGYFIGKIHTYWKLISMLEDVAQEKGLDFAAELEKYAEGNKEEETLVKKLQVETHGDTLYLFDHDTAEFICQGSSVQELAELAKKYKNVLYAAVKYNDKVFAFKDGNSTEVTV